MNRKRIYPTLNEVVNHMMEIMKSPVRSDIKTTALTRYFKEDHFQERFSDAFADFIKENLNCHQDDVFLVGKCMQHNCFACKILNGEKKNENRTDL